LGDLVADFKEWTVDVMRAAMARKELEKNFSNVSVEDVDMIDPGKCPTDHGWDAWQIGF